MALYAVARRCLGGAAVLSAVALSASAPFPPAGAVDGGGGSAGQGQASDTFALERVADTLSVLTLGEDRWLLPFPVYRFEVADVNGDGSADAIVGVVKATRYDPEVRRRVFVYKNYRGHVRPLWLGSRLGQPVADFHFVVPEGVLRVMEVERSGLYLVADYRWRSFGMDFVRYVARECSGAEARRLLGAGGWTRPGGVDGQLVGRQQVGRQCRFALPNGLYRNAIRAVLDCNTGRFATSGGSRPGNGGSEWMCAKASFDGNALPYAIFYLSLLP